MVKCIRLKCFAWQGHGRCCPCLLRLNPTVVPLLTLPALLRLDFDCLTELGQQLPPVPAVQGHGTQFAAKAVGFSVVVYINVGQEDMGVGQVGSGPVAKFTNASCVCFGFAASFLCQ